jgi:ABC-2 type transport system permease protein
MNRFETLAARMIQQVMLMMFFVIVTMIFMSGLCTPVASMPDWAQQISAFMPLRYFILVMRQAYLKGSGVTSLLGPLVALAGFAAFFNIVAVVSCRKRS